MTNVDQFYLYSADHEQRIGTVQALIRYISLMLYLLASLTYIDFFGGLRLPLLACPDLLPLKNFEANNAN